VAPRTFADTREAGEPRSLSIGANTYPPDLVGVPFADAARQPTTSSVETGWKAGWFGVDELRSHTQRLASTEYGRLKAADVDPKGEQWLGTNSLLRSCASVVLFRMTS
jgi:hypothetical protein